MQIDVIHLHCPKTFGNSCSYEVTASSLSSFAPSLEQRGELAHYRLNDLLDVKFFYSAK